MAQLKSSTVLGNLSVTGKINSTEGLSTQKLEIPTASNSTTLGPGTNGQVLKSNGTSIYWGADNNTTYPDASTTTKGIVQVGSNISVSNGVISLSKDNVTNALGYTPPSKDTTYSNATENSSGLMSSEDKTKLDGIQSSADAVSFTADYTSGTKIGNITINDSSTNIYVPDATDVIFISSDKVTYGRYNSGLAGDTVAFYVTDDTIDSTDIHSEKIFILELPSVITADEQVMININNLWATFGIPLKKGENFVGEFTAGELILFKYIPYSSNYDERFELINASSKSSYSIEEIPYVAEEQYETVYLFWIENLANRIILRYATGIFNYTMHNSNTGFKFPVQLINSYNVETGVIKQTVLAYFVDHIEFYYRYSNLLGEDSYPTFSDWEYHYTLNDDNEKSLKTYTDNAVKNNVHEANLKWGGANFAGSYGCIDAAMIPELGANRLAFMPSSAITVEYSTNAGSTWSAYSVSDQAKIDLFNGNGTSLYIGANSSTGINKANYMLRITINTGTASVYTVLNKFAMLISTNGSSGCYCTITGRLQSNVSSGTETWATFANKVSLSGWSGYNIINVLGITTYGNNAASQYGQVRFTFGITSQNTTYAGLTIMKIFGFGGVGWNTPSTMAKTGSLYTYDYLKNITMPADLKVTGAITESGTLLSNKYAKKAQGVYYVEGNTTGTAGTWTGSNSDITSYYDGLIVNYKIGIAGASSGTTLNINGLGAKTCYLRGTTKLTTHYAVGTMLILAYNTTTGAFYSTDYDSNSYVTQTVRTTNGNFPLLLRGASAGTTTTTTTTSFGTNMTANPSTGAISATSFVEDGTALSSKYVGLSFDNTISGINEFSKTIKISGKIYVRTSSTVATYGAGTAGQVLTSGGSSEAPYWSTPSSGGSTIYAHRIYLEDEIAANYAEFILYSSSSTKINSFSLLYNALVAQGGAQISVACYVEDSLNGLSSSWHPAALHCSSSAASVVLPNGDYVNIVYVLDTVKPI